MQLKSMIRYYYTSITINNTKIVTIPDTGKEVNQVEFSHTPRKNVKLYSLLRKKFGNSLKTKQNKNETYIYHVT